MVNKKSEGVEPLAVGEKEAARLLGVSIRHLYNLRQSGLPFVRLGTAIRYRREALDAYLRERESVATNQPA